MPCASKHPGKWTHGPPKRDGDKYRSFLTGAFTGAMFIDVFLELKVVGTNEKKHTWWFGECLMMMYQGKK